MSGSPCVAREDWPGYWPWRENALPTGLLAPDAEGGSGGVPLVDRCLVPPQLRDETDEAFLGRINSALDNAGLQRRALLDSGEGGARIIALEGLLRNAGLAEMVFWIRLVGKRMWQRFIVETHTMGAENYPCVVLPVLEYEGQCWVGLVQEHRFALFGDADLMFGEWLTSLCRKGFLRAVPRGFALSNAQTTPMDRLLAGVPVKGLRRPMTETLANNLKSLFGRKAGQVIRPRAIDGLGERKWFSLNDIVTIDRVAQDSGRSGVVPEYAVARMRFDGEAEYFPQVIKTRFGERGMRFTWHPYEPLISEGGIEESRSIGLIDAHSDVALFSFMRSRKALRQV